MTEPRPDEPPRPDDDEQPDDAVPTPPSGAQPPNPQPPAAQPPQPQPPTPQPPQPQPPSTPSTPPDPDAAFRAIVAGYHRSSDAPVPPWPVEEDVPAERRRRGHSEDPEPGRREPPAAGLPGWVEPAPVEDAHHYVPPPAPPAPRVRPRTVAAAVAILLGVVLLFAPSLLDVAPGAGASLLGLLLAGGGAGALVYWMRDAPGDPDDGAVV